MVYFVFAHELGVTDSEFLIRFWTTICVHFLLHFNTYNFPNHVILLALMCNDANIYRNFQVKAFHI